MEKGILAFLLVGIFLIARSFLKRVSQALPRLPAMEVAPVALPSGRKITTLPAGTGAGTGPETALQSGSTMSLDGPKVVFKEKMSGPIEIEEEEIPVEALKRAELQKRAAQFMTKKPEQAAQLVRSWMMEESGEFKK
jgi:flagellar biosynthesis/type III secretory pathway M-ring protein FliF/YscJ